MNDKIYYLLEMADYIKCEMAVKAVSDEDHDVIDEALGEYISFEDALNKVKPKNVPFVLFCRFYTNEFNNVDNEEHKEIIHDVLGDFIEIEQAIEKLDVYDGPVDPEYDFDDMGEY